MLMHCVKTSFKEVNMAAFILTFLLAAFYIALGLSAHAQTQVSTQSAELVRDQDPNPTQIILKAVPSFGTLSSRTNAPSNQKEMAKFGLGFGAALDMALS